ncbi:hypothetical protein K458DRAFT_376105 [Lentithecium fluviatile CBS 122367]|uniref:CFEM domain-containing protein n=1 Tax=Lentithecium fluviatile CBS 122367 TaxID=1168545 RepID=A0A6G1IKR3_9PLEO|nr:hypothetical protein K458DRAFT_376105 [Lentithecium fluviatile CBS 122367]
MGVRALFGAFLCLLMLADVGATRTSLESRDLSVDDLPPCGLTCLFLTVPPTGCEFSDTDCQCKNDELKHTLSACLLANCTMAESLDTAKVQADICRLADESKSGDVYIYTITTYSIAALFVTLRIIGKVAMKRLAMDDWIIVVALCLTAVPLGCVLEMAGNGFGEHLWNLAHGQLLYNLRLFYVAWSTYTVSLGMTKVSLCIFYLEIFPSRHARMVSYVILTWIVINTLLLFFLTIFNCIPVQAFWDRDVDGKCLDINALAYANSASAIAQDAVLLVFPLACIRRLNMKRYRKFAVGFMFSIGTFGCITTIIRLHTLLSFKTTIDPTWDYVPVTVWTELELACGFVCVSLPAVRILLVTLFPRSLLSSISPKSRSRSAPTPNLDTNNAQKPDGKRPSWMHISTNNYDTTIADESQLRSSRRWPGTSSQSRSRSRSQNRLSSMLQTAKTDLSHDRTRTPPMRPELPSEEIDEVLDLPIPKIRRGHVCYSCGTESEEILALPRIGCLPDESFEKDEVGRSPKEENRWWKEVRRSVERSRCGLGEKSMEKRSMV